MRIRQFEKRLEELVAATPEAQLLETMLGVGVIPAATIALEMTGGPRRPRKEWKKNASEDQPLRGTRDPASALRFVPS